MCCNWSYNSHLQCSTALSISRSSQLVYWRKNDKNVTDEHDKSASTRIDESLSRLFFSKRKPLKATEGEKRMKLISDPTKKEKAGNGVIIGYLLVCLFTHWASHCHCHSLSCTLSCIETDIPHSKNSAVMETFTSKVETRSFAYRAYSLEQRFSLCTNDVMKIYE